MRKHYKLYIYLEMQLYNLCILYKKKGAQQEMLHIRQISLTIILYV